MKTQVSYSSTLGRSLGARQGKPMELNPLGLIFPSPKGKHWRSSNFNRGVLQRAYLAIGWRDAEGSGRWTWHSLRHVFCTTALFTWKLDPTDVSRMAGHANYRTTLDMYVGATAGDHGRAEDARLPGRDRDRVLSGASLGHGLQAVRAERRAEGRRGQEGHYRRS